MKTPLAISLILNILALIFTVSVMLFPLFWRNWRTVKSQALLQFLGSLIVLQAGVVATRIGLLAGFSEDLIEGFVNVSLIGFSLITLTALALVLHAANEMKEAWQIVARSGMVALLVIQPALWEHGYLELPHPLDHDLFGSDYTTVGRVMRGVLVVYIGLTLLATWRFRQRINAPLLTGSLVVICVFQVLSMGANDLREVSLIASVGGVISGLLGYQIILEFETAPGTYQAAWLHAVGADSPESPPPDTLAVALNRITEQARFLVQADITTILVARSDSRLEVVAMAGIGQNVLGLHLHAGEGLAGRVMQTTQAMRVDNYSTWAGRATSFGDLPYCASISIPLLADGRLLGVLNAHINNPGRVFNERDQNVLERLAPLAAIIVGHAWMEQELHRKQQQLQHVMDSTEQAVLIFDALGVLRETNPASRTLLQTIINKTSLTAIELAACAENGELTDALVRWAADPHQAQQLAVVFPAVGEIAVSLEMIENEHIQQPDLLITMQPKHSS